MRERVGAKRARRKRVLPSSSMVELLASKGFLEEEIRNCVNYFL